MRWTLVAVGKLKESHWQSACAEYVKRLGAYRPFEVIELPDDKADPGNDKTLIDQVRAREGQRILNALKPGAHLIALTEDGEQLGSVKFSERLARLDHEGASEIAFVIGGANGLDAAVIQRADWKWGLSRLTLPHQLARVVLVEQLYRAERIRRGEPYHR